LLYEKDRRIEVAYSYKLIKPDPAFLDLEGFTMKDEYWDKPLFNRVKNSDYFLHKSSSEIHFSFDDPNSIFIEQIL